MVSLEQMAARWALSSRQSVGKGTGLASRRMPKNPASQTYLATKEAGPSRPLAFSHGRRQLSSTSRACNESQGNNKSRAADQAQVSSADGAANGTSAATGKENSRAPSTSAAPDTPAKAESPLDQLFTSREDFRREGRGEVRPHRDISISQTVPRSVLGGVLDDESLKSSRTAIGYENDELNRDWGSYQDTEAAKVAPLNYRKHGSRPRPNRAGTQMTPAEQRAFREIFQRVSPGTSDYNDPAASSSSLQSNDDEQPFASLSGGSPLGFSSFFQRNVSERERKQLQQKRKVRRSIALLGEGPASSRNVSTEELTAGIDRIREEVSACQSVHEVWEWARENVWPAPPQTAHVATQEPQTDLQSDVDASALPDSTKADASEPTTDNSNQDMRVDASEEMATKNDAFSSPPVKYGVTSPFYAAVLLTLHTQLRERFHAPHSALAVLWIARRLGPESLVLGCTPALYEAALRTCWTVLHDLEGTYKLVVEARASGILTGEYNAEAEQASRLARNLEMQDDVAGDGNREAEAASEEKIAGLIDSIRADVMREVAHTDRLERELGLRQGAEQSGTVSALHERRLFLIKELARMAPVNEQHRTQRRDNDRSRYQRTPPGANYRPPNSSRPRRFPGNNKHVQASSIPDPRQFLRPSPRQ